MRKKECITSEYIWYGNKQPGEEMIYMGVDRGCVHEIDKENKDE